MREGINTSRQGITKNSEYKRIIDFTRTQTKIIRRILKWQKCIMIAIAI